MKLFNRLYHYFNIAIVGLLGSIGVTQAQTPCKAAKDTNCYRQDLALVYDGMTDFVNGYALFDSNDKIGVIDTTGKVIVQPIYDNAWGDFSNGLLAVKLGDKWGYIDTKGNVAIPFKFDGAFQFSEGAARVFIGMNNFFINPQGLAILPK